MAGGGSAVFTANCTPSTSGSLTLTATVARSGSATNVVPEAAELSVDGRAWSREEARSLAVGDVLGAFRDLAPLYKLLANAD